MNSSRLWNGVVALVAFGVLIGTFGVNAGIDVTAEVNRIEKQLQGISAPPELIQALLQQFQTQCKKNVTIDEALLNSTATCVQKHFNETELVAEIKESIPQGRLDAVFRNICLKWPNVKGCFTQFYKIVDECWQKGEHVTKFVDGFVRFFCGEDNDGARIALFFAEGGMKCLEDHGDDVKVCLEKKGTIPEDVHSLQDVDIHDADEVKNTLNKFNASKLPQKDEVCSKIEEVRDCVAVGLHRCNDSTPENLISAMLKQVGAAVECQIKDRAYTRERESSGSVGTTNYLISFSTILALSAAIFTVASNFW